VVTFVPPARHLLRAKDLIDARYREPLDVATLARAARLSSAHFSREFRRAFGETPHQYLLTRRLERAAALLRHTDRSVADICLAVGLRSVGSFTTSFGRAFGLSPTAYRAAHPPASDRVPIPTCVLLALARPQPSKTRASQSREGSCWTDQPLPSGSLKKTNEPQSNVWTSLTSTPRPTSSVRAVSTSDTTSCSP
jgi:AraC-like DNA-binding protein